MQIPDHYPPILADIARLLRPRLNEHFSDTQADRLALALVDDFCQAFSGSQIYIPKQDAFKRAQRDAAIRQEFDGRNHADLSRRYRLTVTQIYEILARGALMGQSETKNRQKWRYSKLIS